MLTLSSLYRRVNLLSFGMLTQAAKTPVFGGSDFYMHSVLDTAY